MAQIAPLTDFWVEGNLTQQGQVELASQPLPASLPEDFHALATIRAYQIAHVLHNPQYRRIGHQKHFHAAHHIGEGHPLRRGDDHHPSQVDQLHQRQRHVAGAWGQIHHQVIQVLPGNFEEHLLDRPHEQRPAPDQRLSGLDQVIKRHDLQAVRGNRNDPVPMHLRMAQASQHLGDVGAVEVGVQQAHLGSAVRQAQSQVHGYR